MATEQQITKIVDGDNPSIEATVEQVGSDAALVTKAIASGSLIEESYDYIALTYVAAGNGAGEIETATYKDGGSGGTTVATLTLAYNASDQLISVTRT